VVVAGGDGTAGKVGKRLRGSGIFIGLLALGTASKIASLLGGCGSFEQGIATWVSSN
jgi:diacylglycerol kinase (ATP)